MKKIVVIESEYVRDTQIYARKSECVNPWDHTWIDVEHPNLYLGIGTGDTEAEIKKAYGDALGVSPNVITLYDFD